MRGLILGLLFLIESGVPAVGQNTKQEFWPELDIYVKSGERTRGVVIDSMNQDQSTRYKEGSFSYLFDVALKPVFRRELRHREDVLRSRFFTFRAGYQYTTSFVNADSNSENRAIAETTGRVPLPGKVVVSDRNRGEFRFVKGQPYSMRYRNRLWVDRDFALGRLVFTPYVYDEVFYDTRYDAWTTNRYAIGLQIPAGPHLVVEPYVLRQTDRRATPKRVNAAGLTFNLYF